MIGSVVQNAIAIMDSLFLFYLGEDDFAAIGFVSAFYLIVVSIGYGFSGRHFNMMWKTRLFIKVILEVYNINNIYNNPIYDFNGPRSLHSNTHAFDAYDQHNHIHSDGDQLYRQR